MSRVAVITGGAGGMGLATAKVVGRDPLSDLAVLRSLGQAPPPATIGNADLLHEIIAKLEQFAWMIAAEHRRPRQSAK